MSMTREWSQGKGGNGLSGPVGNYAAGAGTDEHEGTRWTDTGGPVGVHAAGASGVDEMDEVDVRRAREAPADGARGALRKRGGSLSQALLGIRGGRVAGLD